MIDFSFHFRESSEEEKKLILDSVMDVQDFSNIQCFTGKRWKNSGIAAVSVMGNVCTILKVKMKDHISTEFSDIYHFYESLIFHLFNFTEKIVWKNADPTFQKDFLEVIAYFDKKVVGKERIRTVYKADVINKSNDMLYYVEKHKKVFIKCLNKPRKEKPLPLMLPRSETGLPVDISDVDAWGKIEYIVLQKGDDTYCIFSENKDPQTDKKHEIESIWDFFDDYEDTSFTKEEIETAREWMNEQLKDENSTLSRYFAQRRKELKHSKNGKV